MAREGLVVREGLVDLEGLVAGEDLGPPSLLGMAGAKLMGREGRSCDVRTEGLFECGRTWICFFSITMVFVGP